MKIFLNPTYEQSESIRFEYFRADILKNIKSNKRYKLLDIGCSQLDFTAKSKNLESYGIDIKKSNFYDLKHFKMCNLDKQTIPFDNNFFDIVIAGEVLEHTKRPFEFIEQISRILKKDGILYLSTPHPYYYLEILKELFGSTKLDDFEHLNLFSRNHLINYLKRNSLVVVEVKAYKFWVPFIKLMILSLRTPKYLNYQYIYKVRKI